MAVINVDDIYILDETGAQVDKVTGLFTKDEDTTSGEKAFAQLNIGTAGSNRNLLDNPWFTVNQKEVTTWSAESYGVDRWYAQQGEATVSGSNVTLPPLSYIRQRFDRADFIGRTFTMSFLDADGNIGFATIPNVADETYNVQRISGFDFSIDTRTGVAGAGLVKLVYYNTSRTSSRTLKALKLETGAFSTLANDFPPDYDKELDHCKWYFERIKGTNGYHAYGVGIAETATQASIIVPMHPKRTTSFTMSTSGAFALYNGGVKTATLSLGSGRASNTLIVTATSSGLTAGGCYQLITNSSADAYIDISANL